jgi:hypothetical protein
MEIQLSPEREAICRFLGALSLELGMTAKECTCGPTVFDAFAKSARLSNSELQWKLQTNQELKDYFKTVCSNLAKAADI